MPLFFFAQHVNGLVLSLREAQRSWTDIRFAIRKMSSANNTSTQQSTVALTTVFVAASLGEGVGGMAVKAQHLNWLCRARASSVWLAAADHVLLLRSYAC
jgi:hypothetical protein